MPTASHLGGFDVFAVLSSEALRAGPRNGSEAGFVGLFVFAVALLVAALIGLLSRRRDAPILTRTRAEEGPHGGRRPRPTPHRVTFHSTMRSRHGCGCATIVASRNGSQPAGAREHESPRAGQCQDHRPSDMQLAVPLPRSRFRNDPLATAWT